MMKIFIFSLLFLAALVGLSQGRALCDHVHRCKNNGTCVKQTRRCLCAPRYFGEYCSHYHECYPKCERGKICVNGKNGTAYCSEIECKHLADIAIAMDCSGSISKSEFDIMVDSVVAFINRFRIGVDNARVSVFAFNDYVSAMVIDLNSYSNRRLLVRAVKKFKEEHPGGGTRTDRALIKLYNGTFIASKGSRKGAPNIGIVITDGKSNRPEKTRWVAHALRDTNIRMIAVGVGRNVDVIELTAIATHPSDVILVHRFRELPSKVRQLVNTTCEDTVGPCDKKPCQNHGHCVPFLTSYICICKCHYVGINCEIKCEIKGDIMIAIDESGSISKFKFNKIINAAMFFISNMPISSGNVRLGVLTFALDVLVAYDLDAYTTKLDMLFACNILRYHYRGGPTLTHKALRYLKENSFTPGRGGRPNVPNYAIVFSDGKSRFPWKTRKWATRLQRMARVFAIGIWPRVNTQEIYYIASYPRQIHMIISSFWTLKWAMIRVVSQVCTDLKPLGPCIGCTHNCKCLGGMACCRGCCRDTITVLC